MLHDVVTLLAAQVSISNRTTVELDLVITAAVAVAAVAGIAYKGKSLVDGERNDRRMNEALSKKDLEHLRERVDEKVDRTELAAMNSMLTSMSSKVDKMNEKLHEVGNEVQLLVVERRLRKEQEGHDDESTNPRGKRGD